MNAISFNSSAIDAGHVTDAPADDITGMVRMGNPDIGAYELTGNLNVTDLKIKTIGIYPNPVEDLLIVETPDKILKLEIFSTSGQLIKTVKESKADVSSLPAGIYIVHAVTESDVMTEKFIKK
ncbi:T9SS type A sorting domain-containing protein [uncultured Chryseobacterium sp.]|uniref:T9SS type A sorting domain-containing protein n=1 Tax=uncultured Chryseobacterium sp. TaxID=259322 RepID=UPI0025D65BE4|nr:T9SS type A sorting domain-containing protein [uncultured Chryseobacterium sp.]